jgi:hypothetical protein
MCNSIVDCSYYIIQDSFPTWCKWCFFHGDIISILERVGEV